MHSEFSQFHTKMHKRKKMLHCSFNFCSVLYKMDIIRKNCHGFPAFYVHNFQRYII